MVTIIIYTDIFKNINYIKMYNIFKYFLNVAQRENVILINEITRESRNNIFYQIGHACFNNIHF